MEKLTVKNYNANSKSERVSVSNDSEEIHENDSFYKNYYEDWDDEDVVEEYFSKRKSRVRKQNKSFGKNYNKYDEEW